MRFLIFVLISMTFPVLLLGQSAGKEKAAQERERETLYRQWKKAVTRSFDWVDA